MKKLYHYLGGVYFAIALIVLSAIFAILGTFIESYTHSHLHAAYFTYQSPLFAILLVLFFINILFATLRRYPFQKNHIPFLITHLGLLMLLAGCIIKSYYGYQGTMTIKEGSALDEITFDNTKALYIENSSLSFSDTLPLFGNTFKTPFKDIEITIKEVKDHSESSLIFFKEEKIKSSNNPYLIARDYFINNALVKKASRTYSLKEIVIDSTFDKDQKLFEIMLDKKEAIQSYGSSDVNVSIKPSRLIIEDREKNIHCFFFNKNGYVIDYPLGLHSNIFAINEGYGGYVTRLSLPSDFPMWSKEYLEKKQKIKLKAIIAEQFSDALKDDPILSLYKAQCLKESVDPVNFLADYLFLWKNQTTHLANLDKPLIQNLDFSTINPSYIKGLKWIASFYKKLDEQNGLIEEVDIDFIKEIWRGNISDCQKDTLLSQTLFSLSNHYVNLLDKLAFTSNELFSAHLKFIGLTPRIIEEDFFKKDFENEPLAFYFSPIDLQVTPIQPNIKWEDNKPMIVLEVKDLKSKRKEQITLSYETYNKELKWPILDGRYLVSFQAKRKKIPHKLRLREAKKITYPNSLDVMSYESDIIIDDQEALISMNKVIETNDGYRFYMSSFQENGTMSSKYASFSVNRDPAKNLLTYPGAFLLSIGTILLFWQKKRNKTKNHEYIS